MSNSTATTKRKVHISRYPLLRKLLIGFIVISLLNLIISYCFYTPKLFSIDNNNKELVIKSSKEVVGITKSITSSEFQSSVMINLKLEFKVVLQSFVYDGSKFVEIKGLIYKVERTYVNGQFIELYLTSTDYKQGDFK